LRVVPKVDKQQQHLVLFMKKGPKLPTRFGAALSAI
jgi:hypothetical protein